MDSDEEQLLADYGGGLEINFAAIPKSQPKVNTTKIQEPPKNNVNKQPSIRSPPSRMSKLPQVKHRSRLSKDIFNQVDEIDGEPETKEDHEDITNKLMDHKSVKRESKSVNNKIVNKAPVNNSTLMSCADIPSKKRRRIPGPAGTVDCAVPQRAVKRPKLEYNSEKHVILVGKSDDEDEIDSVFNSDFKKGPWLSMLFSADLPPFRSQFSSFYWLFFLGKLNFLKKITESSAEPLLKFNLACLKKKGICCRVKSLIVLVKDFQMSGMSCTVSLKDPSGSIKGHIHKLVLDNYPAEISIGAVLVLRKVAVYSPSPYEHILNITCDNIVRVFDARLPRPPEYDSLDEHAKAQSPTSIYMKGAVAPLNTFAAPAPAVTSPRKNKPGVVPPSYPKITGSARISLNANTNFATPRVNTLPSQAQLSSSQSYSDYPVAHLQKSPAAPSPAKPIPSLPSFSLSPAPPKANPAPSSQTFLSPPKPKVTAASNPIPSTPKSTYPTTPLHSQKPGAKLPPKPTFPTKSTLPSNFQSPSQSKPSVSFSTSQSTSQTTTNSQKPANLSMYPAGKPKLPPRVIPPLSQYEPTDEEEPPAPEVQASEIVDNDELTEVMEIPEELNDVDFSESIMEEENQEEPITIQPMHSKPFQPKPPAPAFTSSQKPTNPSFKKPFQRNPPNAIISSQEEREVEAPPSQCPPKTSLPAAKPPNYPKPAAARTQAPANPPVQAAPPPTITAPSKPPVAPPSKVTPQPSKAAIIPKPPIQTQLEDDDEFGIYNQRNLELNSPIKPKPTPAKPTAQAAAPSTSITPKKPTTVSDPPKPSASLQEEVFPIEEEEETLENEPQNASFQPPKLPTPVNQSKYFPKFKKNQEANETTNQPTTGISKFRPKLTAKFAGSKVAANLQTSLNDPLSKIGASPPFKTASVIHAKQQQEKVLDPASNIDDIMADLDMSQFL